MEDNIMKFNKILSAVAASALVLSSCVGDLDITPIDPNVTIPEEILSSEEAFAQLLAECYVNLAVPGPGGADNAPNIDGIDGGYGQYMRAMFYINELPTDEATTPWNDQTIASLHGLSWTTSDVFIMCMYSRIFSQVQFCNEFIRRAKASKFVDSANMQQYIAEARALRALSYYHAIDMFGNVPFPTEDSSIGSTGPDAISRADLFAWLDNECSELLSEGKLMKKSTIYGRLDENFVRMIKAHLNLNAAVYLGISESEAKSYYDEVGTQCKAIMAAYPSLHAKYSDLFGADNDKFTDEIIFAIQADPVNTTSYGTTNFIIFASFAGGDTAASAALGMPDGGWGGLNVTPQFMDKFEAADARNLFWGPEMSQTSPRDLQDIKDFKTGWSAHKFTNVASDGSVPADNNKPSTDLPLFRSADAYLMLAEASLRGASTVSADEAKRAWSAVRMRAGLDGIGNADFTLANMIDERGRELYWECWRRSDLVRFGLLTSSSYLWAWKGGVYEGQGVHDRYNLMPIPATDLNNNHKLTQNVGY